MNLHYHNISKQKNLLMPLGLILLIINILINGAATARVIPENNKLNNYTKQSNWQPQKLNIKKNFTAQTLENEKKTLETTVLDEINKARTNPTSYADWLAEMTKYYYDGWLKIPGERAIRTNQGWENIQELIGYLRDRPPLPPLNSASELNTAARELLNEQNLRNNGAYSTNAADTLTQINSNYTDFAANSSYGDTAEMIVMQLIVENGVNHNTKKNNIFNPDFQLGGVACDSEETYGNYCYIAYANESNSDSPNISEDLNQSTTTLFLEEGILADNDQIMPSDDSRYDSYPFDGIAGQTITITLESNEFDTYLAVVDSQNNIIAEHDDLDQENSNSRLTVTLLADGVYYIIVNSYDPNGRGEYTLRVSE